MPATHFIAADRQTTFYAGKPWYGTISQQRNRKRMAGITAWSRKTLSGPAFYRTAIKTRLLLLVRHAFDPSFLSLR